MPALRWCGRKWRTSSDDFVFSSLFFSLVLTLGAILALMQFKAGDITTIRNCPGASVGVATCLFSLGVVDVVGAVAFLVTAWWSFQGTPFQVSKRRHVSTLLYVTTGFLLASLALCIAITKFVLWDNESRHCVLHAWRVLRIVIVLNFLAPLCQFSLLVLLFDPNGSRECNDSQEYESLWQKRCHFLCCCCFQSPSADDAFHDAAKTLAGLFRGYDMVPSDVVAGVLLVNRSQKCALRLERSSLSFPSAGDGRAERISLQARRFPPLSDHQRRQAADLHLYSRFYMSAYGWLLYEQMHCCTGVLRLCCFDPLMCCRRRLGLHRGTRFYCDVTALLKITGLSEENIILTSWKNALFRPVFFVAVDPSINTVIISIRGTMSFVDCITDLVASPSMLCMPDTELESHMKPEDYYVHGGMKLCAEYVLSELRQAGVLNDIIEGEFRDHKIVVLGHSLGAGVASILSIALRATEPKIRSRIRCFAYAPPGGLMSQALVNYSKNFILACFVGNDIIPRMAAHTFDSLRESIFDALENCNIPKSLLFLSVLGGGKATGASSQLPTRGSRECNAFRESLHHSSCVPLRNGETKLFPPFTLVHYSKAVLRASCRCCLRTGCCLSSSCCKYEEVFVPVFETPEDVQTVVCSSSMFGDHFPDRLCAVIEETDRRLQSGELERFFLAVDGREGESTPACCNYGSVSATSAYHLV